MREIKCKSRNLLFFHKGAKGVRKPVGGAVFCFLGEETGERAKQPGRVLSVRLLRERAFFWEVFF
jgi:hypothetical protein